MKIVRLTFFLCCAIGLLQAHTAVRLPTIFGNNMVLQREKSLAIWGWAAPNEKVTVRINGQSGSAKADRKGHWKVTLPSMPAGGPFELVVEGENELVLSNVLIGDVWICGKLSNMQFRIDQTGYQVTDSTFLRQSQIRLFTVHTDIDYLPRDDVKGSGWKTLSNENIAEFSAVAYHFGKYVHQQKNVPIGLISDNLGATCIETWMSNEALLQFPQFAKEISPIVKEGKSFAELNAAFEKMKPGWEKNTITRARVSHSSGSGRRPIPPTGSPSRSPAIPGNRNRN